MRRNPQKLSGTGTGPTVRKNAGGPATRKDRAGG
nr:MAG TPA: hypothetical protein [Caudoviricetes sp.]